MTRVKKGVNALKTRRNVLKAVKGYRFGRGTKEKQAYEAIVHAGRYSFAHRKDKKADKRGDWQVVISMPLKEAGISYSKFTDKMNKAGVKINRKMLAALAIENPSTFQKVIAKVM